MVSLIVCQIYQFHILCWCCEVVNVVARLDHHMRFQSTHDDGECSYLKRDDKSKILFQLLLWDCILEGSFEKLNNSVQKLNKRTKFPC